MNNLTKRKVFTIDLYINNLYFNRKTLRLKCLSQVIPAWRTWWHQIRSNHSCSTNIHFIIQCLWRWSVGTFFRFISYTVFASVWCPHYCRTCTDVCFSLAEVMSNASNWSDMNSKTTKATDKVKWNKGQHKRFTRKESLEQAQVYV